MGNVLRERLPWWLRMAGKMALARLPVPYGLWRAIGVFRHGDMHDPEHALAVFQAHLGRIEGRHTLPQDFVCLELGPGDSLLSGMVARAFGASKVYMVDAGDYVVRDVEPYRRLAKLLGDLGKPMPEVETAARFEEVLEICRIVHLTGGTRALADIPSGSVDYTWSQVVLEHVPRGEFPELLAQIRRVMQPDGVGTHSVDLRDHLGGGLNNLRFEDSVWEGAIFRGSGFYTNRLRCTEMLDKMAKAGFDVDVVRVERWDRLPTSRAAMSEPFASLDDDELRIAEFEIVMRPCVDGSTSSKISGNSDS